MELKKVKIWTDGSCIGRRGGCVAILVYGKHRKDVVFSDAETTNNRMELMACILGLRRLKEPCEVQIFTDSQYVKNGITQWIDVWIANGWRRRDGKRWVPVKNEDLWRKLRTESERHPTVRWHWVRGHNGDPMNEEADRLAKEAARRGYERVRGLR